MALTRLKKKTVENAIKMMKESGVDALKLQLGKEGSNIIKAVADAGVPIMSHVGLLPHKVHLLGGFKMQGRTAEAAIEIIENAQAIEDAGAIGLEIEAMPYEVGKAVDDAVSIFTFSIGAGSAGTCQLLNGYDLLGAFDTFKPKFAKRYANLSEVATKAFSDYIKEVQTGEFPDADHSYKMKEEEIKNESKFIDDLGADSLDTVELVMALEEEFETEIPDEEAEKITTVQQAVDYINNNIN